MDQQHSIVNALWKIEPCNKYEGGLLTWEKEYRLKHFVTGKYLCVKKFNDEYRLEFNDKDTDWTKFKFSEISSGKKNKFI
jgi:inositol 1,4,5-triphosphate receptor type 3